jgi:hypothetical protein
LYNGSPTTVYHKHGLCDNFVKLVLKEKLTKVQFFEQIMEWEKEPGTSFWRGGDPSPDGVDYYDLYKKGKL